MDDFSTAKVGDKLWSLEYGEIEVTEVSQIAGRVYGASAQHRGLSWVADGCVSTESFTPDLYWSQPTIIAPPRPKRMVERKWEFWIVLSPTGGSMVFTDREFAEKCYVPNRLEPIEHVVITRMVEE